MKTLISADYHVHCGQYYETYYQPATIIKCLYNNGIKNAWISSTTSCINWTNQEEKRYLLKHIDDEILEAVCTSNNYKINLTPLYWVIPKRHLEGEGVEEIVKDSFYKGFKIHTRVGEWARNTSFIKRLFKEVCLCADKYNFPILIHTGVDTVDSPKRFEEYFSEYTHVKFVLAHCKDSESILEVLKKHMNVYIDTAFCSKESYDKICLSGFKERIQVGSDFPITHWCKQTQRKPAVSEQKLISFYQKEKSKIEAMISTV